MGPGAVSAYAPIRRSSSISVAAAGRRQSSSSVTSSGGARVALLYILLKYWDSDYVVRLRQLAHRSLLRSRDMLQHVIPRPIASAYESRMAVAVRQGTSLVLKRTVQLVAEICHQLGLADVARTILRLVGSDSISVCVTENSSPDQSDEAANNVEQSASRNDAASICLPRCFAHRIRSNQRTIDSVLKYWFGTGTPNKSQKSLWMIDSSSVEKRQRVDADIEEQFGQLLLDLLSGGASDDTTTMPTTMSMSSGGDSTGSRIWKEWCTDEELYGWRGKLAAIIVLDQISRHIRRHRILIDAPLPEQKVFDALAYETSKAFQSKHEQELQCGMIPLPMQIFALMPLRHASTLATVGAVQESVEAMASLEKEVDDMVRRFRTATNRRMAVLQDEARREGRATTVEASMENPGGDGGGELQDGEKKLTFTDNDILENHAFDADMSLAGDHPVVKTVVDFLSDVGIDPYFPLGTEDSSTNFQKGGKGRHKRKPRRSHKAQSGGMEPPKTRHVVVSLSGGVDSMVLANVLSYLCADKCRGYQHLNVVSVHVDYGNRPESAQEASFVKRYSEDRLDIPCTVRRINEVTRGITARDEYEKIARTIRFDLYRAATAACLGEGDEESRGDEVGIILGHHRGDLRENVLSNAHKGCGPLDLSGMSSVSRNDGVMIYRPLLPLEKDDVFSYAHTFGVPYFLDTTPHWSTRGKLRNKLLPLLEEIYGEGSMANLTGLAKESDEARDLVNKAILAPIFDTIKRYPMGISFETAAFKQYGNYFWKIALRDILHSASRGMFSDKCVTSFLERVQANKLKPGWLQMRKDYATYLREDGVCFVLDPESFPFHENGQYDTSEMPLKVSRDLRVGPWTIKTDVLGETEIEKWRELEKLKAVESMEEFMSGYVQYYFKVPLLEPSSLPQLVFPGRFTKIGRPKAWKNGDLKIESTLPLVGADATEEEFVMLRDVETGYGRTWCMVRATLERDGAILPSITGL